MSPPFQLHYTEILKLLKSLVENQNLLFTIFQ